MKNRYFAFFARVYEGKTTSGIYLAFYIMFYMLFSIIKYGFVNKSIDFITITQIIVLCALLGTFQSIIFTKHNINIKRMSIWAAINICLTAFFIEYFKWFSEFGNWCNLVMYIVNIIAICMFFLAFKISINYETKRMNKALQDFQSSYKKY